MNIQSVNKVPTSTRVVVANVGAASDLDILMFLSTDYRVPTTASDVSIRRTDNFETEGVEQRDASVVYWTD